MKTSEKFGTKPISSLIIEQSIPAAIGMLVMSLNNLVDTIFLGNWLGAKAIAAVTVVMPIVYLIGAFGMAIGIGGASIISRALGEENKKKALYTFGNQISLVLLICVVLLLISFILKPLVLKLFGANETIYTLTETYFVILMYGAPFLAMSMAGNNVIRSEGKPKFAMIALIIPSIINIILDYFFIKYFNWGMAGAAWATSIAYFSSFAFIFYFFTSKNSELKINYKHFKLKQKNIKEITSLGSVTLAQQGVISLLSIILNNVLLTYGGELFIAVYGIVIRMLMFALFPVMGIMQGFMPIVGYNYGAKEYKRVTTTVKKSIIYATSLAIIIFIGVMIFPKEIVRIFSDDEQLLQKTPFALRWVFGVTPIIAIQLIGAAYFQAIGKAKPALLLTLSKQGFFLIPLLLFFPNIFGVNGVWYAFPIADILATLITGFFLVKELKELKNISNVK